MVGLDCLLFGVACQEPRTACLQVDSKRVGSGDVGVVNVVGILSSRCDVYVSIQPVEYG